jgi:signal transduction histidine kinase
MLCGALVILGLIIISVTRETGLATTQWASLLAVVVGWIFAGAGTLAWWLRPTNGTGPLMLGGAFTLLLPELTCFGIEALTGIAVLVGSFAIPVVIALLLAFPSGYLRGRVAKAIVVGAVVISTVLQAPLYLFEDFPSNPFAIRNDPALVEAAGEVQSWVGGVVIAATGAVLIRRLRRADRQQRRILTPVYIYGVFAVAYITFSSRVIMPIFDLSLETIVINQLIVLAGVPIGFTIGVLAGRFVRSGEIEELGDWLSDSTDARLRLTPVLARTLGDESLEMLFWNDEREVYEAPTGVPVSLPRPGGDRAVIPFAVEGNRVGAIVYDGTLIADPHPVRAAGRVAAIALAHERLTAELRASEEEVRRSRLRIVEAADRERRRIARNLHDGLQVRLVLLAMHAQQVADDPAIPEPSRAAATTLRGGIDDAAAELRVLVHEVMPAALIERGLSAATEDLVDRVPLNTHLELGMTDGKLAPPVESTAYFVVAEALANALKHSSASRVDIRVLQRADLLEVEVSDDGMGGATAGGGSGLRGLADRVDTLGGRFSFESPVGRGTRVVVELPCGS